jgi:hypothetical protein
MLSKQQPTTRRATSEMETTSARPVVVEPGGTGVAAHVGLFALFSFADRLGLGDSLSFAIPIPGESCADIEYLRKRRRSSATSARTRRCGAPSTRSRRRHELR